MKLKNFLIESGYLLVMLIAPWFTVLSCTAHAQQVFSAPDAYHRVYPKAPENGYVLYTRNDSLFAKFSNGDEKYLNVARGVYEPAAQANPGYSLKGVLRTAIKADSLWTVDTTIQADSTFGALNPANSLRVGEPIEAWQWDAAKWEWENPIPIRGDSLFIDDSTFVLLQRLNKPKFGWITDSIKWIPSQHCDFNDDVREKICRHCQRSVIELEQWYQRLVAPPKSEFERLKEKQNARHR